MNSKFSEQALVEQAAIDVLTQLGYTCQNCYDETFGEDSTLGRETPMDVLLYIIP